MAEKKRRTRTKADAATAEATGDNVTLEWKGLTLTLPPSKRIGLDWYKIQTSGQPFAMLRFLEDKLGPEQWEQVDGLLESDEEVGELFAEILAAFGTSEGESPASQDS